jgi:hypothetical protein
LDSSDLNCIFEHLPAASTVAQVEALLPWKAELPYLCLFICSGDPAMADRADTLFKPLSGNSFDLFGAEQIM